MALAFTRIEIPDKERARLLSRTLAGLRTPSGEDWLGRITSRPGGGWEILLSGARRHFVGEWETTVVSAERELFRRVLPVEHQSVDNVKKAVRSLLWDRVNVIVEESCDQILARQMEDTAWEVVMRAGFPALELRLARWPSVWGEVRFVGTLERHDRSEPEVIWCGVVRSPADLVKALTVALAPEPVQLAAGAPAGPARDVLFATTTTSISLAALALPGGVS